VPKRTHRSAAMSSKTSPTPSRRSAPSARSAAPSGPFAPPRERTKEDLPELQYLPRFKNYQFRYDAYPLQEDCFKKPLWPDGAVSEPSRRQESPRQANRWQTGTNYFQTRRTCLWGRTVRKADCEQLLSHSSLPFLGAWSRSSCCSRFLAG
jgi:hypothetical protein